MPKAEKTQRWRERWGSKLGRSSRLPSSASLSWASSVCASKPTFRPLPPPALCPVRLLRGRHLQAVWSMPVSIWLGPSLGWESRCRRRVYAEPYSPAASLPQVGRVPLLTTTAPQAALSRQLSPGSGSCSLSCPFKPGYGDSTRFFFKYETVYGVWTSGERAAGGSL